MIDNRFECESDQSKDKNANGFVDLMEQLIINSYESRWNHRIQQLFPSFLILKVRYSITFLILVVKGNFNNYANVIMDGLLMVC